MEIKNNTIESFLKSFTFSFLLCLFCGFFASIRIRTLLRGFDFFELLHLIFNVIIGLFFLVRVKPSVVSMNPIHWTVALITYFSGLFLFKEVTNRIPVLLFTAKGLIFFAFFLGLAAVLTLGRSMDFLPALRRVRTKYVYKIIRHPMYLSSIIVNLGYVLKNPSIYNILLLVVIIVLYDKRARYEENIMSHNNLYVEYLQQVKYRFIPGIY